MSDYRHFYPDDDLMEHDVQVEDCVCGPTVVEVRLEDGSPGRYFVHRSLDGREQTGGA